MPICNLLDIDHEPTDAELAELMSAVIDGVRERAKEADARFQAHMAEEISRARDELAQMRRSGTA